VLSLVLFWWDNAGGREAVSTRNEPPGGQIQEIVTATNDTPTPQLRYQLYFLQLTASAMFSSLGRYSGGFFLFFFLLTNSLQLFDNLKILTLSFNNINLPTPTVYAMPVPPYRSNCHFKTPPV
jgi:hypothetical protein